MSEERLTREVYRGLVEICGPRRLGEYDEGRKRTYMYWCGPGWGVRAYVYDAGEIVITVRAEMPARRLDDVFRTVIEYPRRAYLAFHIAAVGAVVRMLEQQERETDGGWVVSEPDRVRDALTAIYGRCDHDDWSEARSLATMYWFGRYWAVRAIVYGDGTAVLTVREDGADRPYRTFQNVDCSLSLTGELERGVELVQELTNGIEQRARMAAGGGS